MKPQLFALVLSFASVASAITDPPKLRLPEGVKPTHYTLDLRLDPAQPGYTGRVLIETELAKPTDVIWLNSTELEWTRATVGGKRAEVIPGGRDFTGVKLTSVIPAGRVPVEIEFRGTFAHNDVEGLFVQSEAGSNYLFSQFEPTSARRAFPCFDEPARKVPWTISLTVPKALKAFANTLAASESDSDGMKLVRFRETRPLPSYLVALAVGPFDVVEAAPAGRNHIPVRTVAMKGRGAEAAYANQITPRIIAALEEYFGQPYPYDKLDQVAIPITVGFGAMENAGLITYQQTLLLSRPQDDTISRQRLSAEVITHELAHQWFGNMVTPVWWDDIWLNEAFATWMENRINGKLFPSWNSAVQEVKTKAYAMQQDQLLSARRIRQPIGDPGDIGTAFDGITYNKGAAVIRMFENYVGEDKFRRGVQAYMKRYMWGNATASDFLASISAAAGHDVSPAFSQYLDRGGLPLLTVELRCDPGQQAKVAFTQERSLPLGSTGKRDEYWPVPVCLRWEAGGKVRRECVLISDPRDEVALRDTKTCPAWLNADDQGTGYYHLLYKGRLLESLRANASRLSIAEKVDLLRNTQSLVRNGKMPVGDALALAREFRNDSERETILASMNVVTSVDRSVPDNLRPAYASMIREFYGAKARELGWSAKPGESEDNRLLRPAVLEVVGTLGGDQELAQQARQLALAWIRNRSAVQPEMVPAVLTVAAWNRDAALFDSLLAETKKSTVRKERDSLIAALGSFGEPSLAKRALQIMLTGELDIREVTHFLTSFQERPETRNVAWEFVKANYDELVRKLPSRLGVDPAAVLTKAGVSLCSPEGEAEVRQFFENRFRNVMGGQRSLATTLEVIQLCSARVPVQGPELARFLQQYVR